MNDCYIQVEERRFLQDDGRKILESPCKVTRSLNRTYQTDQITREIGEAWCVCAQDYIGKRYYALKIEHNINRIKLKSQNAFICL